MNFKQLIPLLVIVLASLMSGLVQSVDPKEARLMQMLLRNTRTQARDKQTPDRNYFGNRRLPNICEYGANCEEGLPFHDILN